MNIQHPPDEVRTPTIEHIIHYENERHHEEKRFPDPVNETVNVYQISGVIFREYFRNDKYVRLVIEH